MAIPAAKPLILIPTKSNNVQDNNAIPVTSQIDPALLAPVSPPLLQRQYTKDIPAAEPISPPLLQRQYTKDIPAAEPISPPLLQRQYTKDIPPAIPPPPPPLQRQYTKDADSSPSYKPTMPSTPPPPPPPPMARQTAGITHTHSY